MHEQNENFDKEITILNIKTKKRNPRIKNFNTLMEEFNREFPKQT